MSQAIAIEAKRLTLDALLNTKGSAAFRRAFGGLDVEKNFPTHYNALRLGPQSREFKDFRKHLTGLINNSDGFTGTVGRNVAGDYVEGLNQYLELYRGVSGVLGITINSMKREVAAAYRERDKQYMSVK